ncbi:hypothetical protein ACIBL3_05120 [Kribbella sp. NPDC050124]|uniref:hypothetical protein n=1 Tax=Kribbella sp. NPDC050124 TaxID=3364114 RepID=UPI0037AEBC64
MIEQNRKRRMVRLLVSGLAVAAVAGVAIAGTAVARNRDSSTDTAAAGGPDTPAVTPSPAGLETPSPTPSNLASPEPTNAVPTPSQIPSSVGVAKPAPTKRVEQAPPADPVAACKSWLKQVATDRGEPVPGANAKVVAQVNGAPGTVLILADSKYWAGCDTAFARNGSGEGSIRQPTKIAKPAPGDAEAFTVANNLISIKGKQYEYYWAAGQLPSNVAKISYTFPDGKTTQAVINGTYWVMQHQTATPWKEGSVEGPQIQVILWAPNGQPLRNFLLTWGEDTCAQISHGC